MNADARDSRLTKVLLACGIITGPLFFVVAIIQALTRPGYDMRRNAISQLSLGDLGWIQITSFLLTGLLAVASAIGVRRMLKGQKGGGWGAILMGTFGLGLVIARYLSSRPGLRLSAGLPGGSGGLHERARDAARARLLRFDAFRDHRQLCVCAAVRRPARARMGRLQHCLGCCRPCAYRVEHPLHGLVRCHCRPCGSGGVRLGIGDFRAAARGVRRGAMRRFMRTPPIL